MRRRKNDKLDTMAFVFVRALPIFKMASDEKSGTGFYERFSTITRARNQKES